MIVRLTHIDGKLPNLALMRLARHHRGRGDEVHFTRSLDRGLFEPNYDRVYGSALFDFSADRIERLRLSFPQAIIGGTAAGLQDIKVEDIEPTAPDEIDYTDYPDFEPSIGFTQRGCRFKCEFCGVPKWEGAPRPVNTIGDIWRGVDHPKKLHLLDNDFFGQPKAEWKARLQEIRDGGFRVCFNQGINIRVITDEAAAELASVEYRDNEFQQRRIYTAWDNLGDQRVFFRGIDRLDRAGIPATQVMAYMLVGFDPAETEQTRLHRFKLMTERGIRPYVMVFDRQNRRDLWPFQRWANLGLYRAVPWADYRHNARRQIAMPSEQTSIFEPAEAKP